MGMCKPSGGIERKVGKIGDLKAKGNPNTRIDLYNKEGELIQQRWYGADSKAVWNRDWKHKDDNPQKPHKIPPPMIIHGIGPKRNQDKIMIKIGK